MNCVAVIPLAAVLFLRVLELMLVTELRHRGNFIENRTNVRCLDEREFRQRSRINSLHHRSRPRKN